MNRTVCKGHPTLRPSWACMRSRCLCAHKRKSLDPNKRCTYVFDSPQVRRADCQWLGAGAPQQGGAVRDVAAGERCVMGPHRCTEPCRTTSITTCHGAATSAAGGCGTGLLPRHEPGRGTLASLGVGVRTVSHPSPMCTDASPPTRCPVAQLQFTPDEKHKPSYSSSPIAPAQLGSTLVILPHAHGPRQPHSTGLLFSTPAGERQLGPRHAKPRMSRLKSWHYANVGTLHLYGTCNFPYILRPACERQLGLRHAAARLACLTTGLRRQVHIVASMPP